MEFRFHTKKLLPFTFQHPAHRNTGPFGHHFRDILRSHGLGDDRVLDRSLTCCQFIYTCLGLGHPCITNFRYLAIITGPFRIVSLDLIILHLLTLALKFGKNLLFLVPTLAQFISLGIQCLEFLLDLVHLERHALTLDGLTLDLKLADAAVKFGNRLRHGIHLKTELRSCLIHKVNCLVREKAVSDISMRQFDCRYQGIILDPHLMMILISFLEATHDGNGSRRGWFIDHYHLETPLKGLVSLKILLILIQGSRADGTEFTSCKSRLQDIRGIHRS